MVAFQALFLAAFCAVSVMCAAQTSHGSPTALLENDFYVESAYPRSEGWTPDSFAEFLLKNANELRNTSTEGWEVGFKSEELRMEVRTIGVKGSSV